MSTASKNNIIKFNEPYLSGKEKFYLNDVYDNNHFSGNGKFTNRAQHFLEKHFSINRVLLTHSCTAALEISALLLNLKENDEILLPSYTFVSTASAFLRTGAKLVFCEINPETMCIDVNDIEKKITSKSKVIVPVHYGGIAADMERINFLANKHGLTIVEDAAQGLGSKFNNQYLGQIAPLACISFHETKNIHCGLGGALFINESELIERAEFIWERGTNRSSMLKGIVDKYSWVDIGSSFYISELQAAFLLAQLESFQQNREERRCIHQHYLSELNSLQDSGCFKLPAIEPNRTINYHSFFIICNSIEENNKFRTHLNDKNIQAQTHYVPLHSSKMGLSLGYKADDLPTTEEYAQRISRLPFHNNLTKDDLCLVTNEIKNFFNY